MSNKWLIVNVMCVIFWGDSEKRRKSDGLHFNLALAVRLSYGCLVSNPGRMCIHCGLSRLVWRDRSPITFYRRLAQTAGIFDWLALGFGGEVNFAPGDYHGGIVFCHS